ncbi:MAG: hypothetical protein PHX13_12405 [Thiovulaceae bacterium]|nr:hypothetical protein [Sulfurimonadaceae bacterium]
MNRKQNSKDFSDLDQVFEVIEDEKMMEPNPFLATRIMSSIEQAEADKLRNNLPNRKKMLNPVLVSISLAAAIILGIITGNLYSPVKPSSKVPSDFAYMNDAAIESVTLLTNE